jgi:hypothetical protein
MREKHKVRDGCFKCDQCNRFYPTIQKLNRHISRVHKAERIPCPIQGCKYQAARKEYFKIHILTHRDLTKEIMDYHIQQIRQLKGFN